VVLKINDFDFWKGRFINVLKVGKEIWF